MIYWINFIIYTVGSVGLIVPTCFVLDLKCSKFKYIMAIAAFVIVTSLLKINIMISPAADIVVSIVDIVVCIIIMYKMSENKLSECIFMQVVITIVVTMVEGIHLALARRKVDMDFYSYERAILMLEELPFILIGSCLVVVILRRLFKKNFPVQMNMLNIVLMIYCALYTCLFAWYPDIFSQDTILVVVRIIINIISLVFLGVIIYFASRKAYENEAKVCLEELAAEERRQQASYEHTLERIDEMAKIRHDYSDQIATARAVIALDREKGLGMIEQMRKNVEV